MSSAHWFIRIDATDFPSATELGTAVSNALLQKRLVHVVGVEGSESGLRATYDEISECIGECVELAEDYATGKKTQQRWMEIRYDAKIPDVAAYRHSKNAQPWHTDESYMIDPADVMVMYCVVRAKKGGATNFISVEDIVALLEARDPDLLHALRSTPMTYAKDVNARTRPVLHTVDGVETINFNYYCLDSEAPDAHKALNKRFFEFVNSTLRDSDGVVSLRLAPGEAVFWWDLRLLHGRDSFDAVESNDRFFWKSGIKIDGAVVGGVRA